jgi:raffinose/stachyose/melibiose transport system substrate-binding protein
VVWDQFYRDVESQVMETLNAEFEAAHPGVKIERVVKTLDDLKVTLKLALAEEDGPDVAQVNQGRSDMGAMVEAGLLPLNDYAANTTGGTFLPPLPAVIAFTEDGKIFGQEICMGLALREVVGVYYNKTIFDANGWTVPTTFDEFETLLATIKAAGVLPFLWLAVGWNAIHEFSAVQHLLVTPEYINDFVYGVNNVSLKSGEPGSCPHHAGLGGQRLFHGWFPWDWV